MYSIYNRTFCLLNELPLHFYFWVLGHKAVFRYANFLWLQPIGHVSQHIFVICSLLQWIPKRWRKISNFFICDNIYYAMCTGNNFAIQYRKYLIWPPLWSCGQSFRLQFQRSGFDSRHYQIFWEVVGLERGPLNLVSTIEEILGRESRGFVLEIREYGCRDPSRWLLAPSIRRSWH
jgi:hypothetical protein